MELFFVGLVLVVVVQVLAVLIGRRVREGRRPATPPPSAGTPQGLLATTPLASLRGGAHFGGMALTYPLVELKLYREGLAVVPRTGLREPAFIDRKDLGHLRVDRSAPGASLKMYDKHGDRYDVSFFALSRDSLLDALERSDYQRSIRS